MSSPPRVSVIGSEISVCDSDQLMRLLSERLQQGGGGYVCFTSAHGVVMGRSDLRFRAVTNQSLFSVADGTPVFWTGRLKGASGLGHIPGPDFMPKALRRFADQRHFFYGSTPAVLEKLVASLQRQIPGLNICGTLSPPFRALTPQEVQDNYRAILQSRPDFIWVGLGAPKQELWMAEAWQALRPAILMGVGAAFDFSAGTTHRAPGIFRRTGFEWLYRLSQEPKRLWKRYMVITTMFAYYVCRDALLGEPGRTADDRS